MAWPAERGRPVKKKIIRTCGICGEHFDQSDMVRDYSSDTGWVCVDCRIQTHPVYDEEE